jgi:hypothetical protein
MLDAIIKGIQILQALYQLRGELIENDKSCAGLCERAQCFEKFPKEWQDRLTPQKKQIKDPY